MFAGSRKDAVRIGVWSLVFLFVLQLGGCGEVKVGEAQVDERREIRTYEIVPGTFRLLSDTEPTITVTDVATRYTLIDDGSVEFFSTDVQGDRNFDLDPDDVVIERPNSASVTIITQRGVLF